MKPSLRARLGRIYQVDSLDSMRRNLADDSIDPGITSPPFALLPRKDYGNVEIDRYVAWSKDFAIVSAHSPRRNE
jgi:hypothetical protein